MQKCIYKEAIRQVSPHNNQMQKSLQADRCTYDQSLKYRISIGIGICRWFMVGIGKLDQYYTVCHISATAKSDTIFAIYIGIGQYLNLLLWKLWPTWQVKRLTSMLMQKCIYKSFMQSAFIKILSIKRGGKVHHSLKKGEGKYLQGSFLWQIKSDAEISVGVYLLYTTIIYQDYYLPFCVFICTSSYELENTWPYGWVEVCPHWLRSTGKKRGKNEQSWVVCESGDMIWHFWMR